MDQGAVEYYRRLLDGAPYLRVALCVTYASGVDGPGLIRAFGGDPTATVSRHDLGDLLHQYHYTEVPAALLVAEMGTWQIGIEDNGYQGTRTEVLRQAAAGGTAVSVYWNVNATNAFTYAVDGRTRFGFDMMFPEDRHGPDAADIDAYLAHLPFGHAGDADWRAAGLALAERITGVRLPADFPTWDIPGVVLDEVPQDLIPEGDEEHSALQDTFIQQVLAAPTLDKIPAIAAFRARSIAQDAGLVDEPAAREAMEALTLGHPPRPELRADLTALGDHYFQQSRTMTGWPSADLFRQGHAVRDFIDAAFDRHTSGGYTFRNPDLRLQAEVLGRCASRAASDARRGSSSHFRPHF
ncbi:DUF6461 domain-containing protein [Actinoplanes sp. NEAU-A12]|uniref:DUF6461 domain-containing protein n=1 Tax=Actinoplanes sandaracinus TaxID=3045177 RepID=A0ABT6X1M7_9ACTN|nr:DUF6461 domain-containing protein [Actinoplanes sandaracinus]MDI6105894.1 DUF6461 domain-containing protein [Actinoplanes sandaracinus]